MAELSDDIPARFPHENTRQYLDRQEKYQQILVLIPDEDDAAALSMVYSNMIYLQGRYPAEVEAKLNWIPSIAAIIGSGRDDSADRVKRVMADSKEAFALKK